MRGFETGNIPPPVRGRRTPRGGQEEPYTASAGPGTWKDGGRRVCSRDHGRGAWRHRAVVQSPARHALHLDSDRLESGHRDLDCGVSLPCHSGPQGISMMWCLRGSFLSHAERSRWFACTCVMSLPQLGLHCTGIRYVYTARHVQGSTPLLNRVPPKPG